MTLYATSLDWLQSACDRYIQLDPEFPQRLDAIQGKLLKLEISGINLDLYAGFVQRQIVLRESASTEPDLIVRAAPLSLLQLLRTDDPMTLVQSGVVELRGDVQLARKLKTIFAALDIDWEEMMARVIGDWPAHRAGILARGLLQWRRHSHESIQRSVGEYLQQEAELLPARIEIDNFIAEVDTVREAVDRLEARLNYMETS